MRSANQITATACTLRLDEVEFFASGSNREWWKSFTIQQVVSLVQAGLNEGYAGGLAFHNSKVAQLIAENASLRTSLQQSSSQAIIQNTRVAQLTNENANLRSSLQQASEQASVRSASDNARISQLLIEAATIKLKLPQFESEAERLRISEQKKTQEFNLLQKQLEESNAIVASRDLVISNLQVEIQKFKSELSQAKEKTNPSITDVNARIGMFKKIIATSSSGDVPHQQVSNTKIAYQN